MSQSVLTRVLEVLYLSISMLSSLILPLHHILKAHIVLQLTLVTSLLPFCLFILIPEH